MAKATLKRPSKDARESNRTPASRRGPLAKPGGTSAVDSSERKSIAELAAEQGVRLEGQVDRIIGAGTGLWASDQEFDEFVQGIYARRREGLNLDKA
ncbi:MAG: hypothetical protein ACLQVG_04530 [Terriglobia bacterium]